VKKFVLPIIGLLVIALFVGCAKPKTEEEYVALALEAMNANNYKDAIYEYQNLVKYYPESPNTAEYRDKLTNALLIAAKTDEKKSDFYIKELLREAQNITNDTLRNWLYYGVYELKWDKGDTTSANELIAPLEAKDLMLIAQKLVIDRQPQKAIDIYEKILSKFPDYPDKDKITFLIGFSYSEYLKNYNKAVYYFEQVTQKYPQSDLADDAKWMLENMSKSPDDISFLKTSEKDKKK
jgi:outer membrane protein assembly factor BamD (BamD/ComL family)